jgi:hypothetical protein
MRSKGISINLNYCCSRSGNHSGRQTVEDFVTVLFIANLLDYTVDDKNGELVSGSMTDQVRRVTWARPDGHSKLPEGIKG